MTMHQTPSTLSGFARFDDRTERDGITAITSVRSDSLDPAAPPEKGASTAGPIR